jgi:hypothetical protein
MISKKRTQALLLWAAFMAGAYFMIHVLVENELIDYFFVFLIGSIFSAIEMGSRYKDEPISVLVCSPGVFYIFINGLICCFGLFLIKVFGINGSASTGSGLGFRVTNVLYASLGSFFVMRSSFLKLGSDSSQIDLGLNIVLKKMIDIVDRQVDRDQASRRSSDITSLLKNVSYSDLLGRVKPLCLQVMQNVPQEEIDNLLRELKVIESSDDLEETRKLSMGLELYNIVGKRVLYSVVRDLGMDSVQMGDDKKGESGAVVNHEASDEFTSSFFSIVSGLKSDKE